MEITLYEKINDPIAAVERLGLLFAKSGMFGCSNIEQGSMLALACLCERRSPIEVMRENHIIEGKLSMRADAMQAKFQAEGGVVTWLQSTNEVCEAEFAHPKHGKFKVLVTREELDKSGVTMGKNGLKDNWRKFSRQMLRARAISEGVRAVAPGIVAGVYTPEEVSDFSPAATATESRQSKLPAPAIEPAPAAKPAEPVEVATVATEPEPVNVAKVMEIVVGQEPAAQAWLIRNGWLQAGQTLNDLNKTQADSIIAKPGAFLRAIATPAPAAQ